MYVIKQDKPGATPIPGIEHATWAGAHVGLSQLSLWRQSMAPGGATPPHSHDCDEVVLCLAGQGELHIDGEVHRFGPDDVVVLPGGKPHQLFNVGTGPMETIGIFGSSPVGTLGPDGAPLELPWRS